MPTILPTQNYQQQPQNATMQALSSATGLGTAQKPSLMSAVRSMVKELLEELLIIFMKFKAWLTPGTADDKVRSAERPQHAPCTHHWV